MTTKFQLSPPFFSILFISKYHINNNTLREDFHSLMEISILRIPVRKEKTFLVAEISAKNDDEIDERPNFSNDEEARKNHEDSGPYLSDVEPMNAKASEEKTENGSNGAAFRRHFGTNRNRTILSGRRGFTFVLIFSAARTESGTLLQLGSTMPTKFRHFLPPFSLSLACFSK